MTYPSELWCETCDQYFTNCKLCPLCYTMLRVKENPDPSYSFKLSEIIGIDECLMTDMDVLDQEIYDKIKRIIDENRTRFRN